MAKVSYQFVRFEFHTALSGSAYIWNGDFWHKYTSYCGK